MVLLDLLPAQLRLCDSDSRGSKAGRGRKEKANHEDLKALAFHASGEDFFEVFEVFEVRFYCQCLNRRFRLASLALRG